MQIVIIDAGSQYTLVISRILRELGIRSVITSPNKAKETMAMNLPGLKGIIISGGDKSVYDENAPKIPDFIFEDKWRTIPLLGICYGMQYIAHFHGAHVIGQPHHKNYGGSFVIYDTKTNDPLIDGMERDSVWASHSDSVMNLPPGFQRIARYDNGGELPIAGFSNAEKNIWGVQFHPEVTHTQQGTTLLKNFLFRICHCATDWKPSNIVEDIRSQAVEATKGMKSIIGFSGGVDSTTLAAILSPVLQDNLRGVSIDTGGFRKGEVEEIEKHAIAAGITLDILHSHHQFQQALKNITDAEHKRKAFKEKYRNIFELYARDFGADFILQGSIAPDVIESGATGGAALIKSHHNIGHTWAGLTEVPLLANLFKYEVREIAKFLGLPDSVVSRQPFPGPGLFLRVIGAPPTVDKLEIVREADEIVTEILKKNNVYGGISQLVVALICSNTVGIKGDARTYGPSIVVRAIETQDFMTVKGFQIPSEVRREISSTVSKHPDISRVWFDEMDKPPATVEFE